MKKVQALVLVAALAAVGLSAQVKGPIVDKILLDAKTSEDIAIKDVAAGKSDLFNYGSSGAVYKGLPDDIKAKLDPYAVTGALYDDLYINPYPNKAPYTATTKDGKVQFNPFAIREVRFAMNFLINRKKIIDEILVGAGAPMFTPVVPGQPNSSKFGLRASKLGFTPTGNEAKGLADIDAAMQKAAAADPKLVKTGDGKWTYNGAQIELNFLIRVDDPSLRLPMGRYIASELEKAGFKVNRLEYDRAKCSSIWNKTDPADYQWNLYTDAWGGGQTYAFWDTSIAQMYAPWFSFMPGGGKGGVWNYQNDELDSLTQAAVNGRVKDSAEYYDKLMKATDIGLQEALRVFICATTSYTPAAKDRFESRMLWGSGDGINNFSMYSADVKPDASGPYKGQKVLRMSEYSAKGALFMAAWDPIGPDGFGDTYSAAIIKEVSDQEYMANPVTGIPFPTTATWYDKAGKSTVKTGAIDFSKTPAVGSLAVPAAAVLWNTKDQKWESGINYVDVKGDGSTYDYVKVDPAKNMAWSMATYTFKFGRWHDGRDIDINDYRYALARPYDLSYKHGDNDKIYEESYAGAINPNLPRTKGVVFNKDNSITVYGDANYPMDPNTLASLLMPTLMIEASNYGDILPWTIHEALRSMVADGAASKTQWVFNDNGDFTEVDLLNQTCTDDILAKLQELAAKKAVPASLAGFVTPDQAVAAYNKSVAFIKAHGHAVISNGGFVIDKYDPKNNTMVLTAFRDSKYPFEKGWFTKQLSTTFIRIDGIKVGTFAKGKDLTVSASLSDIAYPAGTAKAATKGDVKVTIVGDAGDIVASGKFAKAGTAEAVFKASDLAGLKSGKTYTVVVEAGSAVDTANLIIF